MGVRDIVQRARELRSSSTDAERQLWQHLRGKQIDGFRFRRQRPIGNYIADFVCLEARLVIELDGGQHAEQMDYDAKRDAFMRSEGFRVLRFWNGDVFKNLDGVLAVILEALHRGAEPTPSQPSPLQGKEPGQRSEVAPSLATRGKVGMGAVSDGTMPNGVTK